MNWPIEPPDPMILYSLACDSGHRFDSWFRDSAAFEDQAARALIGCPSCASTHVVKTIMAPAVVSGRPDTPTHVAPPVPADDMSGGMALLDDKRRELRALIRSVREKVVAEAQDVGERFPEEARRIHDGEAPTRQIYGLASIAEARDLIEDGIMVLPLPVVPDELN